MNGSNDELIWIDDAQDMRPFLMSIVSDTDLWMFISSSGGMTAGRMDPDNTLFPYYVEDRLHQAGNRTGGYTLVRLTGNDFPELWEPWTQYPRPGEVSRRLGKDPINHRLVFEEHHHRLKLTWRQEWTSCERFGFVRTVTLRNDGNTTASLEVLDGLLDLMPPMIPSNVKALMSQLVHAYSRCEMDPSSGIGVFTLQSLMSDTPEPGEALRANVVWPIGMQQPTLFLSGDPIACFRAGREVQPETDLKGRNANYLAVQSLSIPPGQEVRWRIVADVNQDQCMLAETEKLLHSGTDLWRLVDQEVQTSRNGLRRIVGLSDGLQVTADSATVAHHQANVLFNVMRGGIFVQGYTIARDDLSDFLRRRNPSVAQTHQEWLSQLEDSADWNRLCESAMQTGDPHLIRLINEYLPLYFGRRHGDPSRPWNRFRIEVKTPDGNRILNYQGNWRDIFQNWEALCLSFPEYLEPIIFKFLNASTVDGFNPFRVTRNGIEWEVPEEHDLGGTIGYWGDHQIIYLTRLIEWSRRFHPGRLEHWLDRPVFAYADVPYRFHSYERIVEDPKRSMWFDAQAHRLIEKRVQQSGTDGRLLHQGDTIVTATLAEKLLVPVLSKLSNFVLDGGIWMNTQRPEWNDANNALAGYGLSMVTLCYLRRHLRLLRDMFTSSPVAQLQLAEHVKDWLERTQEIFSSIRHLSDDQAAISDAQRRQVLDALGISFEQYRRAVQTDGPGAMRPIQTARLVELIDLVLPLLDRAIRKNRRTDGLYHAYNVVRLKPGSASVVHLFEMLEGQVAALSSGCLSAGQQVELIRALYSSALYRPDQNSFMLAPNVSRPTFRQRNQVPSDAVESIGLLRQMVRSGDTTLIRRDAHGIYRFHPDFRNVRPLRARLDELAKSPTWSDAVKRDGERVVELYERVFDHHRFIGRAGMMYGYEGLGCIYWHMVSKLLLAVGEAVAQSPQGPVRRELAELYWRIRGGLSAFKTPKQYGAFPSDPYSHTPAHSGAQQPGMTGQVKEEIIARWIELGVGVSDGRLHFDPRLLRRSEFLTQPAGGSWFDLQGTQRSADLQSGQLLFTIGQVPVVYELTGEQAISTWLRLSDGQEQSHGQSLPPEVCRWVFERLAKVQEIRVRVPSSLLM